MASKTLILHNPLRPRLFWYLLWLFYFTIFKESMLILGNMVINVQVKLIVGKVFR